MNSINNDSPSIILNNVYKFYGEQKILDNINITFFKGEIHTVLGENEAGKSTFAKVISGLLPINHGIIKYCENEKCYNSKKLFNSKPKIGIIDTNINLLDNMTVFDNIFIGSMPAALKNINSSSCKKLKSQYELIMSKLGVNIELQNLVKNLSLGEKRFVEIAKLILSDPDILVFDQPTIYFSAEEASRFYNILKEYKNSDKTVIYISNIIDKAIEISDKISIISNGRLIQTINSSSVDLEHVMRLIFNHGSLNGYPKIKNVKGKPLLKFENVCSKNLKNINFILYQKEIIGITGSIDSRKSLIGDIIIGKEKINHGKVLCYNQPIKSFSPQSAIKHGIGYISNTISDNLIPHFSAIKNVTLTNLTKLTNYGFIQHKKENKLNIRLFKKFSINIENISKEARYLSYGTQQKICIAKTLFSGANIMILDEPTKGIDSAAKSDIYNMMNYFVGNGNSIILLSSDFAEILGMCDRIIIMNRGKIVKELKKEDATKEKIAQYSLNIH